MCETKSRMIFKKSNHKGTKLKTILINNPAAKSGGAVGVLKQLMSFVSKNDIQNKYVFIVSDPELLRYESKNVKVYVTASQGFIKRIQWDNWGLKKFIIEKKLSIDVFLSFQNTPVNIPKNIRQLIYYHQPLTLSKENWNFFKATQRLFWFYKNVYPYFIKLHLNRVSHVIVQTEWIKTEFSKRFNFKQDNILVLKPEFEVFQKSDSKIEPKSKRFLAFYPSASYLYKNHEVVLKALKILKENHFDSIRNFRCIFTLDPKIDKHIFNMVKEYNLQDFVIFKGVLPFNEIKKIYSKCSLVLFPSYIESFGLPLIEGAGFGRQILTVDRPYAREVLKDYKGAIYLEPKSESSWAQEILKLTNQKKKTFKPLDIGLSDSWDKLIELINTQDYHV